MGDIVLSRLVLTFVTGFTDDGEPIFKVKQFRNIAPEAANENLFNTAVALASLQKHDLDLVERNNTYELGE